METIWLRLFRNVYHVISSVQSVQMELEILVLAVSLVARRSAILATMRFWKAPHEQYSVSPGTMVKLPPTHASHAMRLVLSAKARPCMIAQTALSSPISMVMDLVSVFLDSTRYMDLGIA